MSNGLKKWFAQKWVDIGSKRKDGSFAKCGRSKQRADAKRKYPKCVPLAKARRMTDAQRRSAVARKRAVANVGPKPKGKFRVDLFTFDAPKIKPGDNIITAVEDTKVDIDPNLNYSRIYKDNIQVDLGISSKGKGGIRIKKVF